MSDEQSALIDIQKIQDLVHVGARRASAFLTIANSRDSHEQFSDFSLGVEAGVFDYWPKPLSELSVQNAIEEFDNWIVGVCLREAHLHLEIFLNEVWPWIKVTKEHGAFIPRHVKFVDENFTATPSVSKKYEIVCDALGIKKDALEALKSLHFARNCLSHSTGHVRRRDCNDPEKSSLTISWLKFNLYLTDEHGERPVREAIETSYVTGPKGAALGLRLEWEVHQTNRNEKLVLKKEQVAEILFFYVATADKLTKEFVNFLSRAGVKFSAK